MGRFCHVCGRSRPNEKFTGRGHRDHICRDCQRLPKERLALLKADEELWGFVEQSNISEKNKKRLKVLMESPHKEIREMAGLLARVAAVAPRKKKRWMKVREADPELYAACEKIGWTGYPLCQVIEVVGNMGVVSAKADFV